MNREQADIAMQDPKMRVLWLQEALGLMSGDEPYATFYQDGMLYVHWSKEDVSVESYDTSNIYGECEDDIPIDEFRETFKEEA